MRTPVATYKISVTFPFTKQETLPVEGEMRLIQFVV